MLVYFGAYIILTEIWIIYWGIDVLIAPIPKRTERGKQICDSLQGVRFDRNLSTFTQKALAYEDFLTVATLQEKKSDMLNTNLHKSKKRNMVSELAIFAHKWCTIALRIFCCCLLSLLPCTPLIILMAMWAEVLTPTEGEEATLLRLHSNCILCSQYCWVEIVECLGDCWVSH